MIPLARTLSGQPFGRYHLRDSDSTAPICVVNLLGIPIELYVATRQQQSDLVRELVVLGLGNAAHDPTQPPAVRRLIQELGLTFTRGESRADEQTEAAQRSGALRMDLQYRVPATVPADADRLAALMERADDICARGLMLTMARTPSMLALSHWWMAEFHHQIAGRPPTPWADSAEAADPNVRHTD